MPLVFNRHAILSTLVIILGSVPSYFLFAQSAQDSGDDKERRIILWQFTASSSAIAFPISFGGTRALAIIDRATGMTRLVSEPGSVVSYPQLSADGKRLLFVRWPKEGEMHEMISCVIATWRCRLLLRAPEMLSSPIEIGDGATLFVSSPLITRFDGQKRYSQNDFCLLDNESHQTRLTDFRLAMLSSLNLSGQNLIFSAYGPPRDNPAIPDPEPLAKPNSEIFRLEFDPLQKRIQTPAQRLHPLSITLVGDYSAKPSVSDDGQWIAFLNQRRAAGRNAYHLAIGLLQGSIQRFVAPSGIGFSRPAFVGNAVLVNELFDDRYEVKLLGLSGRTSEVVAVLDHSFRYLTNLERIAITLNK